jgi:hypothetical protein
MAFPYSTSGNAESVADQIDSMVGSAIAQTSTWRASVNSGAAIDSQQAEAVYQALVSLRAYVLTNGGRAGLDAAYKRRFASLPGGFNPVTEWTGANTAIVNFGTWFASNWPERTASNKPAFAAFNPTTGELQRFTVDLAGSARASLVGYLDAVLAAFVAA